MVSIDLGTQTSSYQEFLNTELSQQLGTTTVKMMAYNPNRVLNETLLEITCPNHEPRLPEASPFHIVKKVRKDCYIIAFTGNSTYPAQFIKRYNQDDYLKQLRDEESLLQEQYITETISYREFHEKLASVEAKIERLEEALASR